MTAPTQARPVVLVSGAARRIGAVIAQTLHAAGHDLALHCRNSRDDLDQLIAKLERERPNSTLALQADLSDLTQMPALIEATMQRFGRLDGLVNNASDFFATAFGSVTSEQWDRLFASNARAPFFLAQAAAPHLKASRGAIVNLADIYAERPLREHPVYCMAKAALVMATKSLALELAPEVRVNAIAPGAILWAENETSGSRQQSMLARTPLARTGTPAEIAEAVRWLLRDATYSTGQVINVDGGRMLGG